MPIGLREPKARQIKTATVVKIKLIVLRDDCIRIDRGAKVETRRRLAANHARFRRQCHMFQ